MFTCYGCQATNIHIKDIARENFIGHTKARTQGYRFIHAIKSCGSMIDGLPKKDWEKPQWHDRHPALKDVKEEPTRLKRIHDCLLAAGGEIIRELKTPHHSDTIEWWDIKGKIIIIQRWENDAINCFRHVQEENDMTLEIRALDEYINL